jgi:hypothetical protein
MASSAGTFAVDAGRVRERLVDLARPVVQAIDRR